MEELRREFRFFREPTFNEVALKSGCLDSSTIRLELAYAKWTHQDFKEAKNFAEYALNLAGWLKFREKGPLGHMDPCLIELSHNVIDSACLETIKKAQLILNNYPRMVPKVNSNELKWPKQTKIKWKQVFGDEPPAPQTWK